MAPKNFITNAANKPFFKFILVICSFLILAHFGIEVMGQKIEMTKLKDGTILKKEYLHEEDYTWSPSKCILYVKSKFEKKKWEKKLVLGAQEYYDVTTKKFTRADPAIILYEGGPEELLSYLNQCEEILILQPVFEDKHMMKNNQVYVTKTMGTPHINIYFGGKGWVTIGAKAIKRIKKPFLRWAKKQDIHLDENPLKNK